MTVSDETLLERFAKGRDREAAAELVARHQRMVYDLAHRVLGRESDAADVTQETFFKAFRSARRFRAESTFRTWLFRIALNEARRALAKRRSRAEVSMGDREPEAAAPPDPQRAQRLAALEGAVQSLPDAYRDAVVLHYFEGFSYEEVAGVLGCAPGTVGSRLSKAREKLRERLAAVGGTFALPEIDAALTAVPPRPLPPPLRTSLASLAASVQPARVGLVAWIALAATALLAGSAVLYVARSEPPASEHALRGGDETGGFRAAELPARAPASAAGTPDAGATSAATSSRPAARKPAVLRVHGTVRVKKTGWHVAGATVQLTRIWPLPERRTKGGRGNSVRTGADGTYALEDAVPAPALYTVRVWPGTSGETAAPDAVLEVAGERKARVDFDVEAAAGDRYDALQSPARRALLDALARLWAREGKAALRGRLQKERGAKISEPVFLANGVRSAREVFDPVSGEFLVGPLEAGSCKLVVAENKGSYAATETVSPARGLFLTLREGDAPVSGIVFDATGRPVAGARVSTVPEALVSGDTWLPPTASGRTGEGGRFLLQRAARSGEEVRLYISASGWQSASVSCIAGGDAVRVDLEALPLVVGRLLWKGEGGLPKGCRILAWPSPDGTPQRQMADEGVDVDPETGAFEKPVSSPGLYDIEIEIPGHARITLPRVAVHGKRVDLGTIEIG